jgi:5-methylcytosine-specific restriction protein B
VRDLRDDEFRSWLKQQGYAASTIDTQLSSARSIERAYGDLDKLYDDDAFAGLMAEFRYSADDRASGRPNPTRLDLWGDTNRDLTHLRMTLRYYLQFREGRASPRAGLEKPNVEAVERALAECDELGVLSFMEIYGFSWSNLEHYLLRQGRLYPSKAVFAVAHQYMPGGSPLDSNSCHGTEAYQHLGRLGFVIDKRPALLLFGADGVTYEPIAQENRATGRRAYRYKPAGASNRTQDAIEVSDLREIARALLVEHLPVRIAPTGSSTANYLTYPGQKFSRYWLRPDLAAELGLDVPTTLTSKPAALMEGEMVMNIHPTNLILHGPPGTGKTWRTAYEAVRLCDGTAPAERHALMARYHELEKERRIAFVTFHQSMDYESFVEGLRPETEASDGSEHGTGAGFRLEPRPGIFREICSLADQARRSGRREGASAGPDLEGRKFWKMGLGAIGAEDFVYEAAIEGDYIVLGWGGDVDWSDPRFDDQAEVEREWKSKDRASNSPSNYTQLWPFRARMKKGDIVIVPYGNSAFRAVAEVTGDYEFVPGSDGEYNHRRKVNWLLKLSEPLPLDTVVEGKFTMRTLYPISEKRLNKPALRRLLAADGGEASGPPDQFVLIIDEINRANVSKVFGELITLIEPDKRLGQENELEVLLPYSRKPFGVPDNLHIVGTMNTADRSIALLDTALRRRFEFVEVAPSPKTLQEAAAKTGLPLVEVLSALNDRIEYLVDRDHRIGHAFFVGCASREAVDRAFKDKVIPLLQEYFFEDWRKVALVLGETANPPGQYEGAFLDCRRLRDPTGEGEPDRLSWTVREEISPDAYARLVAGTRSAALEEVLSEGEVA